MGLYLLFQGSWRIPSPPFLCGWRVLVIPLLGQAVNPRHNQSVARSIRTAEPSDFRRILEMFVLIMHQFNISKSKRDSRDSPEKFRLHILEKSNVSNLGVLI